MKGYYQMTRAERIELATQTIKRMIEADDMLQPRQDTGRDSTWFVDAVNFERGKLTNSRIRDALVDAGFPTVISSAPFTPPDLEWPAVRLYFTVTVGDLAPAIAVYRDQTHTRSENFELISATIGWRQWVATEPGTIESYYVRSNSAWDDLVLLVPLGFQISVQMLNPPATTGGGLMTARLRVVVGVGK